jgi:hypothetical protein
MMMTFKQYLDEANTKSINFFDIDETLLQTKAKIYVIKDGEIIKKLSNQQFNNYQLQPGESFDFREFRDADLFAKTSKPIVPMIKKIKSFFKNLKGKGEIALLTARGDFDNKEKILEYFKGLGIDVGHFKDGKIHIIRTGNLGKPSAIAKKEVVSNILKTNKFYKARLYDDDKKNLETFLSLQQDFPNIIFEAYIVNHGTAKRFKL